MTWTVEFFGDEVEAELRNSTGAGTGKGRVMSKTKPVNALFGEWHKDPEYRKEYAALEEEFALAEALIEARTKSNLTQEQIAERMGTSRTAVVRLEGGKGNPSLNTLRRFAEATGTRLRVHFE